VNRTLLPALLSTLALCACLVPQQPGPTTVTEVSSQAASAQPASSRSSVRPRTGSGVVLGERMLSGGILEFGSPAAAHTLTAVIHYASPYSRIFLNEQKPRLLSDFVRDGTLKLRFLPLDVRKYSQGDAQASAVLCAAAQGKGMTMHDALATGDTLPEGKAITALGLDLKAYQACLKSPDLQRLRAEQRLEAQRLGVTLVPTFILDDQTFQGLQEYPDLRGRIRNLMQEKAE
jgi:protein-disulfide isomerase